jgi:hypothetical protein
LIHLQYWSVDEGISLAPKHVATVPHTHLAVWHVKKKMLDGLIISAELTCKIANSFSLDHVICSQDSPIFNRPQKYFDWKKSKLLPSSIMKVWITP